MITVGLTPMAAPRWAQQLGLDILRVSEHRDALRSATIESIRVEDEASQLWASIHAVEYTANRLIVGTLSLSGAVEAAEPFVSNRPGFSMASQCLYTAPTFRLMVARYLIARVRSILENDPYRLATTLARLEAEYCVMLRK
jgi:hypothetical protein